MGRPWCVLVKQFCLFFYSTVGLTTFLGAGNPNFRMVSEPQGLAKRVSFLMGHTVGT